jgi:hypothetical protein
MMKATRTRTGLAGGGGAVLALVAVSLLAVMVLGYSQWIVVARSTDRYAVSWWTVDGGGWTLGDGGYSLSGTVGQPDAGPALIGNGYTLVGGFWYGVAAPEWYDVHLPVVLRSY